MSDVSSEWNQEISSAKLMKALFYLVISIMILESLDFGIVAVKRGLMFFSLQDFNCFYILEV